jgi:hypothetical protein
VDAELGTRPSLNVLKYRSGRSFYIFVPMLLKRHVVESDFDLQSRMGFRDSDDVTWDRMPAVATKWKGNGQLRDVRSEKAHPLRKRGEVSDDKRSLKERCEVR